MRYNNLNISNFIHIQMEDIDYGELIKMVEKSTKSSYEAYQIDGAVIPNVANLGAKRGEIAKLNRHGEYYGIAVQFMEDVKPLLTDRFVSKILAMLKKEDYITPLALLGLTSMDQLQYILHKWMQRAVVDYDDLATLKRGSERLGKGLKKKYTSFDDWIGTVTHDPLPSKIKLVEVGVNENTGQPVVPFEWIDREFDSGYDLHKQMGKLESRIGKPPVTYAIIYSMVIQKNDTLIEKIENIEYDKIFYIEFNGDILSSQLVTKARKGYQYVKYGDILVGFKLDEILEPKNNSAGGSAPKLREVGILVSRLQKCIRRGKYASKALIETVDALNESPNYNLPEHGFLRVSASKQMVWRLFITIFEDCRPYQPIKELGLLDLLLLVLITQKVQEYKFTKKVLMLIKLTAVLAQYNDSPTDSFPWRMLPLATDLELTDSDLHNAITLATNNIIMMSGDNNMLKKYYSSTTLFEPFVYPPQLPNDWQLFLKKNKFILHNEDIYMDTILSSYDMHNKTHIILYYQACIPISLTTKEISGYIWDISSSYNVRYSKKRRADAILRSIQIYFHKESLVAKKLIEPEKNAQTKRIAQKFSLKEISISDNDKRTSFLVLFGKKYKYKGKDVILAGTKEMPARVKIENEWTYYGDRDILNAYPRQTIHLSGIDPPFGYRWTKDKVVTEIVDSKPMINSKYMKYFDGSSMLESITPNISKKVDKQTYQMVIEFFSGLDIDFSTLLKLRKTPSKETMNWIPKPKDIKKLNIDLVQLTYTKIFNNFNNIIMIGPTDRSGKKMQNSINYLLEGKLWAIFNLLCHLYPETLKTSGGLNFIIKKESPGYIHLVKILEKILFQKKSIQGDIPVIKTELWDHQKDSVSKILAGFSRGRHGFGDASQVSAGKTLISLQIAAKLIEKNNEIYSGVLVLLPGNKLIKTWQDELEKHTSGFDVKLQSNNANIGTIKRNTIVVTTMSKMRDHPINHKWLFLIIDECLTVQNRNALWTESAWRQSLMSKHLIMLSATFFRTRFDKLYYMLKMLRTGLPERKEYLDTILLESIVSQVSKISRKWFSKFNYFELDNKSKIKYDEIDRKDLNTEAKFSKLTSFLISNDGVNYCVTEQLKKLIKKLERKGRQCLIYARAVQEAELWSNNLGIPIYPKKGTHCIITYHDGTYGLNDLVIYDTIVMRPPQPDKLPQIKGRVDRTNQRSDNLYIEYFVIKNTIEEGLILRMNIASNFVQNYIMPLSKFYDISVNYEKYIDEENIE